MTLSTTERSIGTAENRLIAYTNGYTTDTTNNDHGADNEADDERSELWWTTHVPTSVKSRIPYEIILSSDSC